MEGIGAVLDEGANVGGDVDEALFFVRPTALGIREGSEAPNAAMRVGTGDDFTCGLVHHIPGARGERGEEEDGGGVGRYVSLSYQKDGRGAARMTSMSSM